MCKARRDKQYHSKDADSITNHDFALSEFFDINLFVCSGQDYYCWGCDSSLCTFVFRWLWFLEDVTRQLMLMIILVPIYYLARFLYVHLLYYITILCLMRMYIAAFLLEDNDVPFYRPAFNTCL